MTKDIDFVWPLLQQHQGRNFLHRQGPAVYLHYPRRGTVRGPAQQIHHNFHRGECTGKIVALEMDGIPITGPKKIGCYGASYLYPVLLALGILPFPTAVKM